MLLLAATGSYFGYARREYMHGGSRWGLVYGTVGFLLCYLLAFFGIRKRWYRSTLEEIVITRGER